MTERERMRSLFTELQQSEMSLRSKMRQLRELRALATELGESLNTGFDFEKSREEKTEESGKKDPGQPPEEQSAASRLSGMEAQLEEEIRRLLGRKQALREIILSLERPEYRTVLELRYLSPMTWEAVAEETHYSLHYLYKIHNRALDAAAERLRGEAGAAFREEGLIV